VQKNTKTSSQHAEEIVQAKATLESTADIYKTMATMEATKPTEQQEDGRNGSRCSFVITGFGPFAGVPNNPTSTLISCLRNNIAQLLEDGVHIRETHILDTSAEAAKFEIQGIYSRLCSDKLNKDGDDESYDCSTKDVFVMLHLGVNYRGKKMQLEQCAYNDATFRVPDNNGYQPQQMCILGNSSTFGQCLRTTLDLNEICTELQQQGQSACCISQDPGRFVCNYTYCLSLDQCKSVNDSLEKNMQQSTKQLVGCHSLFLHVTPFAEIPEDNQLGFIVSLLKLIDKSISQEMKNGTSTKTRDD